MLLLIFKLTVSTATFLFLFGFLHMLKIFLPMEEEKWVLPFIVWVITIYFYLGFIISWAHKAFRSSKNNYSSERHLNKDSTSLQYFPSSIKQAQAKLTVGVLVSKSNTLQVRAGNKAKVLSTIVIPC